MINALNVIEIVWKIWDSRRVNYELLLQFRAENQKYLCTVALLSYRTVYIHSLRTAALSSSDNICLSFSLSLSL